MCTRWPWGHQLSSCGQYVLSPDPYLISCGDYLISDGHYIIYCLYSTTKVILRLAQRIATWGELNPHRSDSLWIVYKASSIVCHKLQGKINKIITPQPNEIVAIFSIIYSLTFGYGNWRNRRYNIFICINFLNDLNWIITYLSTFKCLFIVG